MRESKIYAGVDLDAVRKPHKPKYKEYVKPAPVVSPQFEVAPNMPCATKSENLKKRAGKKLQTFILNKELAALNSPMKPYYLRAMQCCNDIRQEGKTFTANYCGCRSCKICTDIRQSKLTEKYHEILESLKEKRFVTLTVRNIRDDVSELKWMQQDMFKHHRRVQDLLRKHKIEVRGIRKYEPIPAKDLNGFHPHFHWIIEGEVSEEKIFEVWATQSLCPETLLKMIDGYVWGTEVNEKTKERSFPGWMKKFDSYENETEANQKKILAYMKGEMLIQLWLKKYKGFADRKGQDCCEVTEGSEAELFKYTTKLLVKTKNNLDVVPVRLLDMVFNATKGVRTIQVTGYVTSKPREVLKSETNPTGEKILVDYRRIPKDFWTRCEFALTVPLENTIRGCVAMPSGYVLVKRISNYYRKLLSYLTYKNFTEIEDADIEDDLTAQEYADVQECSTVFCWRGDNWYCVANGQPLADFKPDIRINRLLEALHFT